MRPPIAPSILEEGAASLEAKLSATIERRAAARERTRADDYTIRLARSFELPPSRRRSPAPWRRRAAARVSFWLRRPPDEVIREELERQRELPFSYEAVGATRDGTALPRGFRVDRARTVLGAGDATFARSCAAVRAWCMFDLDWVELCWPDASIRKGSTVGLLARLPGLHTLSACRIVYVIEEVNRFGFGYGTLPGHPARGEERFLIERDAHGEVCYELLAFSRPGNPVFALGTPVMRALQKRFRNDSLRAMQRAVREGEWRSESLSP